MQLQFAHSGKAYRFDTATPIEISIPLVFNGPQPNAFGVALATAQPYGTPPYIGDVQQGGSCNYEQYTLVPHCNGTHTECVGHLTQERIHVNAVLKEPIHLARLVTVWPELASSTREGTDPAPQPNDQLITRAMLAAAWGKEEVDPTAIVIRTQPNGEYKRSADYPGGNTAQPPYFTREAMQWLVDKNVQHLLVDTPSVDRLSDEGRLTTHRTWWGLPAGSQHYTDAKRPEATITEFIFVPDAVADGLYVVHIQIPSFSSDAAPSRIFLYELA